MLPVRRPRRPLTTPSGSGPVLFAARPSSWLEREMADENQVERYAFQSVGPYREDPHPSRILRTRSEGRQRVGELYGDMLEKDGDLAAFADKRADAVLALPHDRIVAGDSSPDGKTAAEFARQWMKDKATKAKVNGMLRHLVHDRSSHGTAIVELIYERMKRGALTGSWAVVGLEPRPMHRFLFRNGDLYVRRPAGQDPILAPAGKFMVLHGGPNERGWGKSLSDYVYWYWFIKKHGWKFYSVFIEKFAQPTVKGTYRYRRQVFAGGSEDAQGSNQEEQNKMLAILQALQSELAVALPEGLDVNFLEATRSSTADYGSFIAMCTRGEALVYLGEINTSGLRPGTGAYASDQVANDVRFEKVIRDADDAMGVVMAELLAPMIELNFGAVAPVPTLQIETIAGADLEQRRQGVELLWRAGRPVLTRHLYQVAQAEEPQDGDDVTLPPAPAQGAAASSAAPPPATPPAEQLSQANSLRFSALAFAARAQAVDSAEQRSEALDEVAAHFKTFALDYYAHQQELALQAWDAGHFGTGDALRWLVPRLDAAAHAQRIHAAEVHGIGLALAALIADGVGEQHWVSRRRGGSGAFEAAFAEQPDVSLAAPPGFGSQSAPQTAIDWWARLLKITKDQFNELDDPARRLAFTAAGVTDVAMLTEIHNIGSRATVEGWTRDRFRQELADLYRRNGLDPTADWHADLIYTNNIRQANAAVRFGQIVGNPTAERLIPYLGWATIGDDKVRQRALHNHAVMADRIFATSHAIWRTWWYPAGHGCRCLVYTINRPKAERMGLIGAEPTGPWPTVDTGRALPDPGFRGAPSLDTAALANDDSLDQLTSAASSQGADLVSAINLLLKILGIGGNTR